MTVALAAPAIAAEANPDGYSVPLVSGVVVTASDTTGVITLPYIPVGAKAKLVVVASAVGGTNPTCTVNYFETADGVSFNGTAALTSGSITANGTTWGAAGGGPVFNKGELSFTLGGTTPTFTLTVYLVVFNR